MLRQEALPRSSPRGRPRPRQNRRSEAGQPRLVPAPLAQKHGGRIVNLEPRLLRRWPELAALNCLHQIAEPIPATLTKVSLEQDLDSWPTREGPPTRNVLVSARERVSSFTIKVVHLDGVPPNVGTNSAPSTHRSGIIRPRPFHR